MRGLSALHKQPRPPLRCDKRQRHRKPNARHVGNGMEDASRAMGSLARNSFCNERRAYNLIAQVGWRCDGALRRPRDYCGLCFCTRTRNLTMEYGAFPLRSPTFSRGSRTSEVASARAVRDTCGNVIKSSGRVYLVDVR